MSDTTDLPRRNLYSDSPYTDLLAPDGLDVPLPNTDPAAFHATLPPDPATLAETAAHEISETARFLIARTWTHAEAVAMAMREFDELVPPPHIVDQFALGRPWRDAPSETLFTLRDAYRADRMQSYPGLSEYEWAVHLFVLSDMIAALDYELSLRERGGANLRPAAVASRAYPPEWVNRVKNSINLMQIIAEDTGQRPPGGVQSSYRMHSPFRADKHPSFAVYTDGHWYDYTTHEHGDAITYAMRRHGLSFTEAVEMLSARAGIPLPEDGHAPADPGSDTDTTRRRKRDR